MYAFYYSFYSYDFDLRNHNEILGGKTFLEKIITEYVVTLDIFESNLKKKTQIATRENSFGYPQSNIPIRRLF